MEFLKRHELSKQVEHEGVTYSAVFKPIDRLDAADLSSEKTSERLRTALDKIKTLKITKNKKEVSGEVDLPLQVVSELAAAYFEKLASVLGVEADEKNE